jgi:SWI/SNF-related matrix-associated actin-dependent regulator of chromatin subfamily A-like protein 1
MDNDIPIAIRLRSSTYSDKLIESVLVLEPDLSRLFPYQKQGVEWLRSKRRALLADDMGLGKSAQVLRALPPGMRSLLLCPASLRLNWEDECKKWRSDLTPVQVENGDCPLKGQLCIMSYDSLEQEGFTSLNLRDVYLIADEAHYLKNPKAKRTKAFRRLSSRVGCVWLLTGTPLVNTPIDLFEVLKGGKLHGRAFGSKSKFLKLFGAVKKECWKRGADGKAYKQFAGWDFKDPNFEAIKKSLGDIMLRRQKEEVLPNLPKRIYKNLRVELPTVSSVVDDAEEAWTLYGADRLPPFEMLSKAMAELARAKIPAMLDQLAHYEEHKEPVIVFSAHRDPINAIKNRTGWGVVTGDTLPKERHAIVQSFQAGELVGIALTIQSGGIGINLTRGSNILFVDQDYAYVLNEQAIDRARRIGAAAKHILVTRLVADHPLDERLTEILAGKRAMHEGALNS